MHRDIKLENIFLRWSSHSKFDMPDIVLGDFGGAVLESQNCSDFGTSGCYAPEVLRHRALEKTNRASWIRASKRPVMTKASDVYTFGACMCYMLLWGNYAPGADVGPAFNRSIIRRWPLLVSMLKDSLADNPEVRPSTESLFNWAATLRLHVRYLYANGVRMPDGSWAQPPPGAPDPAQAEAVLRDRSATDCVPETPDNNLWANAEAARTHEVIEGASHNHMSETCHSLVQGPVQSHPAEPVSKFSDDSDFHHHF